MALTLEKLLAEVRHEELSCVAGFKGLHKEVLSVNIMDTPDIINWVVSGELLLSAGYVLHQNPQMVPTIVENLIARGCVGLGIKEKRYFDTIPREIIDKGNALDFPIFSISYDLRLSTVSQFVFQNLFNIKMSTQEQIYRLYTNISKTILSDKNINQALYEISQIIPAPIVLLNRQMELIACEIPAGNRINLAEYLDLTPGNLVLSSHDTLYLSSHYEKNRFLAYSYPIRNQNDSTLAYNFVLFPLVIDRETLGFLGFFESTIHLDVSQYCIIEEISSIIGMHLLKNSLANNIPQLNFQGKFIDGLLKSSEDINYIRNHCNLYGFDYTKRRTCIVIESSHYLTTPYHIRKVLSDNIYAAVGIVLKQNNLSSYSTQFNNCFVWYLLFSPNEPDAQALLRSRHIVAEIEKLLRQQDNLNLEDLQIGLSCASLRPYDIVSSFNQAQQAIKIGNKLYPHTKHSHFFDQDLIYHLLSGLDKERLKTIVACTIAPLKESDERSHTDFLITLAAFFENQFNYSKTSAQLHIHRNTLAYRLAKIQELTLIDFLNDRDLLNLQVGLYAQDYLDIIF